MSRQRELLVDEIALRRASIKDAKREFDLGELSLDRRDQLVAKEETEIRRCESELSKLYSRDGIRDEHDGAPPTRRVHKKRLLIVALACFLVAAGVLLYGALSPRSSGGSDTGSVPMTSAQKVVKYLNAGEIDELHGDDAAALVQFDSALAISPTNVEALSQSGWLTFSAGSANSQLALVQLGESRVAKAVSLEPRNPAPRLYYAIIAATLPKKHSLAIAEFKIFRRLHPTLSELSVARPWMTALGMTAT